MEGRGCGGGGEWWVGEEGGRGREKNEGGRVAVGGWWWGAGRGRVGGPAGLVGVGALVCVAGWLMGSLVGGGGVGACVLSECLRVRVGAVHHRAPCSEGSEAVLVFAFFFQFHTLQPTRGAYVATMGPIASRRSLVGR